jgi:hypothetical protein
MFLWGIKKTAPKGILKKSFTLFFMFRGFFASSPAAWATPVMGLAHGVLVEKITGTRDE